MKATGVTQNVRKYIVALAKQRLNNKSAKGEEPVSVHIWRFRHFRLM